MKTNTLFNELKRSSQKLLLVLSCLLAFIFGWSGNLNNFASAATIGNNVPLIAEFDNSGIGNQIEGIGKQIGGRTQQEFGKSQSQLDDAANKANQKADAISKQVKGRTEENAGKAQDALQNTGNKIGDTAEDVINSIKDFFNQ